MYKLQPLHKVICQTVITVTRQNTQLMQTYSTVTELLYILYQYWFYQPIQDHYWNLHHACCVPATYYKRHGIPLLKWWSSQQNEHRCCHMAYSQLCSVGLHTIFILLNPRSQVAVLTGSVFTWCTSCLSLPMLAIPRLALNSLNSRFSALMGIINRSHNNRSPASPYSTSMFSGHVFGFKTSAALHSSVSD